MGLHGAPCDVGGMQTRLLGSPHSVMTTDLEVIPFAPTAYEATQGDALLDGAAASVSPDASNQCR